MIPLQLTLKNFLSYREATLDFRGLHTACICGANGAGKSSLLEAITWVIWGESRAASEDDVIHAGAENVRVDFQFISDNETYRIIRYRQRGRSSNVDFQIESSSGFRAISGKGLKVTQEQIITYLKLDYDTFINSAYLRQGRADEFMLRKPTERKQILADLLKLDQYEVLASQAKDLSRQLKGQAEQLELNLQPLKQQLEQRQEIEVQRERLQINLQQLQQEEKANIEQLQKWQREENQRQTDYQQLTWKENQYQNLIKECERLNKEKNELNLQLYKLENILNQETEIIAQYQQLINLQQEEESLATKFQIYQEAQQQKQQLEQQILRQNNELNLQLRQRQTRLESLEQQEQEIQQILSHSSEVKLALEKLRYHRQRLNELDKLQHQFSPLLQRRYNLETEIERIQARLSAKLEHLRETERQQNLEIAKIRAIKEAAIQLDQKIQELDKKQVYQKRVEEKGQEKRSLQESLQTHEKIFIDQIEELNQKLQLLDNPEANCPLCEQELDEHHRHQVINKTHNQQQKIEEQIWLLQEQISVTEREIQNLRNEYTQLKKDLTTHDSLKNQFGQLEAQLEALSELQIKLKQVKIERNTLEKSLLNSNYAQELQLELNALNQELQKLNYDEKTHGLVRGEVERWRWAEIKQAKLEEANRRQASMNEEKPKLLEQINRLKQEIEQLNKSSPLQQKIKQIEHSLRELNYERAEHQNLLTSLRQAQSWQFCYQELQQTKQHHPSLKKRLQNLSQQLEIRLNEQVKIKEELDNLLVEMEQRKDRREEIKLLEQKNQQKRQSLDQLLAQQGRIEQTVIHLNNLQTQIEETEKNLAEVRQKNRVYEELAKAFGKNGIQALMIENILPNLEAETNQILARLTGNQLHIQFVTQRAGKTGSSKAKAAKIIDTLDILIADAKGTRPYETYSGGEAFRINFSIRLALARLLTQKAGTSLQMLIVDEGFGTQDIEGCERLIAAINGIASDFSCILTVTHMPQFKEAFQHRIEVRKTNKGSQLSLLN